MLCFARRTPSFPSARSGVDRAAREKRKREKRRKQSELAKAANAADKVSLACTVAKNDNKPSHFRKCLFVALVASGKRSAHQLEAVWGLPVCDALTGQRESREQAREGMSREAF